MRAIDEMAMAQKKPEDKTPKFNVGDTVRVHFRIVEGEKERVQVFEGVVIGRKGKTTPQASFTVRRVAFGEREGVSEQQPALRRRVLADGVEGA